MSKKETKLTHAAHIKRHTEGTSNELSFSVLDAAKRRADEEAGKAEASQIPRFGKVPVFSLPGGLRQKKAVSTPTKNNILPLSSGETIVSPPEGSVVPGTKPHTHAPGKGLKPNGLGQPFSQPFGSPEDEIGRRKARRRRRRTAIALIGALVTLGLLGGGGYYLYKEISNHQQQISLLDQALAQIKEVDKVVVPLDEIVNNTGGDTAAETIENLLATIPDAYKSLDRAEDLARQAGESMRDSVDKEAADQALVSIEARRAMLEAGKAVLQADLEAKGATEYLSRAWKALWGADALAREAAALVTDTTNENVTASRQKSEEALNLFGDVAYMLVEIEGSPLQPDLQAYKDYVAKRRESMQYAIASDDAILAQDREAAESQNTAYNLSEEEAAQIAKQLPINTAEPIRDAYKRNTEDSMRAYAEARHKASTADAFLRDYLGT